MSKQNQALRLQVGNRDMGVFMLGGAAGILLLGLISVVCVVVTGAPLTVVVSMAAPSMVSGLLVGGWTGLRAASRQRS